VVRTFGQADFQFSTYGSTSSLGIAASVNPGATAGLVNNDTSGNGYTAVELVFLQFAGFTFGKSASAFSDAVARLSGQQHLVPDRRLRLGHRYQQRPVHLAVW